MYDDQIMALLVVFGILVLVFMIALYYSERKARLREKLLKEAEAKNAVLQQANNELVKQNDELVKQNKELAKYQDIIDVKEETRKIRENNKKKEQEADAQVESAMLYYLETMRAAETEKNRLLDETHEKLKDAVRIINSLEAYENRLKRYKDEHKYFVSPYTLIDELGGKYSYHEIRQQLTHARAHSRKMAAQGKAATCEYADSYRRDMAINFVVDSFDSKVEVILSKAKKDNYGVMEQKIKDTYSYVNDLGRPFRNAVITPEYLSVKLNELKWVCRVHLLLQEIKNEEAAAKEKIREELRAQKERDKIILKTQKEIMNIEKSREKLRQEIQEAAEKDREKLLSKLRMLEEKLKESTTLRTRAISMAEMVSEGNVYIVSNIGSFGQNIFKIGMTRRLVPEDRINELSNASVPFPFDVHAIIHSKDAPTLEASLHKIFNARRVNMVNLRKEFFEVPLIEIKAELEKQGIEAEWTEAARAEQYRESLARKKALKEGRLTGQSLDDLFNRYVFTEEELENDDDL